jgi:predicted transcriptional regulator
MYHNQRPDVRIQLVDGETLVLDDENGYIHQLNPTASFIWSQCDGKSTTTEIAQRLAKEFNVEVDVATRDVTDTIEKLRDLNLLSA